MTIPEVLDELGVEYRRQGESPHVTAGWVGTCCPYCGGGDGNYGLGFPIDGFASNCWKCGSHPVVEAICQLTGGKVRPPDVISLLGPRARHAPRPKSAGTLKVPAGVGPLLPAHEKYLRGRGLNPSEIVRLWGVGGIGPHGGKLSWRLYAPITSHGEVVSWTTRSIADNPKNRYLSASPSEESAHHKDILYGADLTRDSVVVVEGPADCWAVGPGAVATLGVGYTPAQVFALSKFPRKTVCMDSDGEAQRRGRALARVLECFPGSPVNVVTLASGKDAAECSEGEIKELRKRFLE